MRRFKSSFKRSKNFNLFQLKRKSDLIQKYGLKNKKEYSKLAELLTKNRTVFRRYTSTDPIFQSVLKKLHTLDVLSEQQYDKKDQDSLDLEAFMKRRLQTLVSQKFNLTLFQARQKITHGKVKVENKIRRFPGYLIRKCNEEGITLDL